MKCRIVRMRRDGVVIPKRLLPEQPERRGELSVVETREQNLNRLVRLAKCLYGTPPREAEMVLYDPQLLWVNEDRLVITGFERVTKEGQEVDYAQSWLCKLGEG